MAFDVTGALITGVILFLMLRKRSGVGWFVFVGALFGFFLAGTGVHGAVHDGLHGAVLDAIDYIKNHVR
ncbi:hypothetical protein ABH926_008923 [Catenulispora sp. GP43]|uniref:hypothetical protein n=1 Tax=Catenulispora sp. GP43 TaxID=3156263 RepID=UPI0035193565